MTERYGTAAGRRPFSGSYEPADVEFLLKPISMPATGLQEKERLIQSGARHYSEMIGQERLPSARYLSVFHDALERNLPRLARDFLVLAELVGRARTGEITLVSLARAGTPVGVVLRRVLAGRFARAAVHYSVSIIRDRGLDINAIRFILAQGHRPESVVFLDGWTGKGVIAQELHRSVMALRRDWGVDLDPGLYVLQDLALVAAAAATDEDYLIPSSILSATISGLVSRSILNADHIGPEDFHGCVSYPEFAQHDLSRWFADRCTAAIEALDVAGMPTGRPDGADGGNGGNGGGLRSVREAARAAARQRLVDLMATHGITDWNLVKPGIGEATRVLLRRVPDLLLVRSRAAAEVRHLLVLAEEKSVPVEEVPDLSYQAVSLIRRVER